MRGTSVDWDGQTEVITATAVGAWVAGRWERLTEVCAIIHREDGAQLVEYVMVLAFVALVAAVSVGAVGRAVVTQLYDVANAAFAGA